VALDSHDLVLTILLFGYDKGTAQILLLGCPCNSLVQANYILPCQGCQALASGTRNESYAPLKIPLPEPPSATTRHCNPSLTRKLEILLPVRTPHGSDNTRGILASPSPKCYKYAPVQGQLGNIPWEFYFQLALNSPQIPPKGGRLSSSTPFGGLKQHNMAPVMEHSISPPGESNRGKTWPKG